MDTVWSVRPAEPRDADELHALWVRLSADGHAADDRYRLRASASELARSFIASWAAGHQPTWVAEQGGHVVGFMVTKSAPEHPVLDAPPTLVVTDAFVADEHRRTGMGRALFTAVSEHAEANGFACVEVGTLTHDVRAVQFWRSLGFGDWRVTLSRAVE